jgi:hypothetical protein
LSHDAPGNLLPADGRQSANALRIARGVRRHLYALGYSTVAELPLRSGRRADLMAINSRSEIWIIEIKSSIEDLRADIKWPDYRLHCDRLFFATSPEVPDHVFPRDAGLLIADGFGAQLVRDAPSHRLPGATRKEVLARFARCAADRLHALFDPGLTGAAI